MSPRAAGLAKALAHAGLAVAALLAATAALASCRGGRGEEGGAVGAGLTIYSSHPEELVRTVVAEFRDRSGIRVAVTRGGTGELLARLRAEAADARGRRGCDLLWGGGAESLAANADLFEPYDSPEAAAIPAACKAPDSSWTGFTLLPMAIGYNVRLLPPARVPRSWEELLDPRFRGRIAYADPAVSGSSYTILRTLGTALSAGGKRTRVEAERAFAAAIDGRLLAASASVFPSVASGENLVGLYHDEGATELISLGSDLRITYPTDGTSAVPDGIALLRGAPHPEAARRFFDFALGKDVAAVVSERFHRRSARADCPPPPGQVPLSRIRLVPYDIGVAAAEKEATIRRFKEECERVSRAP